MPSASIGMPKVARTDGQATPMTLFAKPRAMNPAYASTSVRRRECRIGTVEVAVSCIDQSFRIQKAGHSLETVSQRHMLHRSLHGIQNYAITTEPPYRYSDS